MREDREIPLLLQLLFGEAADAGAHGASRRLRRWSRAFDEWLAERKQAGNQSIKSRSESGEVTPGGEAGALYSTPATCVDSAGQPGILLEYKKIRYNLDIDYRISKIPILPVDIGMKDFTGISEERRKIEQWAKLFETASERIRISQALIQTSEELLQASTEPLQLSEACMRTSLEVIQKARARIIETRDRFTGADQREGSN